MERKYFFKVKCVSVYGLTFLQVAKKKYILQASNHISGFSLHKYFKLKNGNKLLSYLEGFFNTRTFKQIEINGNLQCP